MNIRSTSALLLSALTLLGGVASAHHSAANVDSTRTITVTGTVKEFRWTNPHTWIVMMVPNQSGGEDEWQIEGTSLVVLARAGWRSSSIQQGEKIDVTLSPLRSGAPGGVFFQVKLPSGDVLKAGMPPPVAP
jgi:hypothetical protein